MSDHTMETRNFVKPIKGCKTFEDLCDRVQEAIEILEQNPRIYDFKLISVSHSVNTAETWNAGSYSNCKIWNAIIAYSCTIHIRRKEENQDGESNE